MLPQQYQWLPDLSVFVSKLNLKLLFLQNYYFHLFQQGFTKQKVIVYS